MSVSELQFVAVADQATRTTARALIGEYLRWIEQLAQQHYGLAFDIDAMVDSDLEDPSKFYPPQGRFYLVRHAGANVGVGCLKQLAPGVGEIQRMYLQPQARKLGAGRLLLQRLLDDAQAIGYHTVRLESLRLLSAAHTLYRSVGFVEIPPYADNSMQDYHAADAMERYRSSVVFMERRF